MAVVEFSLVHMEWAMLLFCFLIYLSGNTVLWLWLDLLSGEKMNTKYTIRS